jgi:hypothetical protein
VEALNLKGTKGLAVLLGLLVGQAGQAADPPSEGAQRAVLVDEVVAAINRHVVTRSEVLQEALLIAVEQRGASAEENEEPTGEFLGQVLELLINQRVLLDDAGQAGAPPVSDQEREQLLEGFKKRFMKPADYQAFRAAHALAEETIAESLVRHLRVERIKEVKLAALPEITDQEVRRYFEDNRSRFGGAGFEAVAEAIRLRLVTVRNEQALARWTLELR